MVLKIKAYEIVLHLLLLPLCFQQTISSPLREDDLDSEVKSEEALESRRQNRPQCRYTRFEVPDLKYADENGR